MTTDAQIAMGFLVVIIIGAIIASFYPVGYYP